MVKEVGIEAVGLDEMIPPEQAISVFGDRVALQGNLPPQALFAPKEDLLQRVRAVQAAFKDHPGHVFNLGHGILPPTPVPNVQAVVEEIRGG